MPPGGRLSHAPMLAVPFAIQSTTRQIQSHPRLMIEFSRETPQPAFPKRAMKSTLPLAFVLLFAATAHAQSNAPVITRAPVTADEKPSAPAIDPAALADLREQNKKLSAELATAWKEND